MQKTNRYLALIALLVSSVTPLVGCEDDTASSALPYNEDETVVLGSNENGTSTHSTPNGDECLEVIQNGECIRPQDLCGEGARADVIVDENGNLLEYICYPLNADEIYIDGTDDTGLNVPDNKTTIVLDDVDDGVDVEGDVVLDGNKNTLYGQGADVSVIDGNVTVNGNKGIARGVRITGDVTLDGNTPILALCIVEGNVEVIGNNAFITDCEIFGDINVQGNNTALLANRIQGQLNNNDKMKLCELNRAFTDEDMSLTVEEGEIGELIECPEK